LSLDFPSRPPERVEAHPEIDASLGASPAELWKSRDYFAVFENEAAVRALKPDFARMGRIDMYALIATAPGDNCDFVSRFFAPSRGIDEDPVTGSAHCTLIPFWANRLGKVMMHARQISKRGGELFCELRGDRVKISGHVALYSKSTINVG
jgi:predicted PhzF superfamily epimerase YddE/YHI9